MAIEIAIQFIVLRVTSYAMCFVFGAFLVLIEFATDFKEEVKTMNENWKTNPNVVQLVEKLSEIVWFNVNIRELSLNSFLLNYDCYLYGSFCRCIAELTDIYRLILIDNFIWSAFCIFGSLIMLQSEMVNQFIFMS